MSAPTNVSHARNGLLAIVAGGLLGYLAWGPDRAPTLALLLPALWMAAPGRASATLSVFCYYLLAMRGIPSISVAYFTPPWSYVYGFGLWSSVAIILSSGWLLVDVLGMRQGRRRGVGAVLSIVVVAVPPIGIVGAANPILGLGWIAPGAGFIAIGIYLCLLAIGPYALRQSKSAWTAMSILAVILCMPMGLQETAYNRFAGIVAADTTWGALKSHEQAGERFADIGISLRRLSDPTVKAIIYPETTLGPWQDSYQVLWDIEVKSPAVRKGIEVGIGAERPNGAGGWKNSLLIQHGDRRTEPFARQTLPVTMYRPWDVTAFPSDWFKTNVEEIGGKRALLLFCFEEHLPWLILPSIAYARPEVIVTVSNIWWGHDSVEPVIQKRHTEAISKLFGIPLVRAANQ